MNSTLSAGWLRPIIDGFLRLVYSLITFYEETIRTLRHAPKAQLTSAPECDDGNTPTNSSKAGLEPNIPTTTTSTADSNLPSLPPYRRPSHPPIPQSGRRVERQTGRLISAARSVDVPRLPNRGSNRTPLLSGNRHRRCASVATSSLGAGTEGEIDGCSLFNTLRRAIHRREAASVASLIEQWRIAKDDPSLFTSTWDSDGYNLLQAAVIAQSVPILRTIIEAVADGEPEIVNSPGNTANSYTPLHLGALRPSVDIVRVLLEAGADTDCKSKLHATPLHLAASKENLEIVRLLLEAGANPNVVTKLGYTPLLTAVLKANGALVDLLAAHGANPRLHGPDVPNAIQLAMKKNVTHLLKSLEGEVACETRA